MVIILTVTVFTAILFGCVYYAFSADLNHTVTNKTNSTSYIYISLLLAFAFLIRAVAAVSGKSYEVDMNCFIAWGNMVFEKGFGQFYSKETFTDYPPGYMYVLYVIGGIRKLFSIDSNSIISIFLTKLPAILCDLGAGYFIYKIAMKRFSEWNALLCSALYLLCPVVILNSSVWGQVDAVFTLAVLLTCYFVTEKKLPFSYFAFAVGILIKPQTLIITPVLIYGIVDQVFLTDFDIKRMLKEIYCGLGAIVFMFLMALPYGIGKVIPQYIDTLGSYKFATVNAYNIWTMFGLNWHPQNETFFALEYSQWGTLFIIATVILSAVIFYYMKKEECKYYLTAAFIIISMFMFSVRMHERYMFPAIILLLMCFILTRKRRMFLVFTLYAILHFCNTAYVLFVYDNKHFSSTESFPMFIAFCNLVVYLYMIYVFMTWKKDDEKVKKKNHNFQLKQTSLPVKIVKFDIIAIIIISVIYGLIAFYDLGDRKAPESAWSTEEAGTVLTFDLGENKDVAKIDYYLGNYENREFAVRISSDGESWIDMDKLTMTSVFKWDTCEIDNTVRYVQLTSLSDKAVIFEMTIVDQSGNNVLPINADSYKGLFDEQEMHPQLISFRNSTYFDEIYHARTAYEFIHGIYSYENTHPPLGKILISLGIRMFGMNPFGWRFMGTLFGVMMLPAIYLFLKKLLKESWLAVIGTILFAFDFMHFAQTRIATIDVFVTFFIIVMYYFMYLYTQYSFYDTKLSKTLVPLGLCGLFTGFGIASKWTGMYAAAGLALIFFYTLYQRYAEFKYAKKNPNGVTGNIRHEHVINSFIKNTTITILFCMVVFIIIPFTIYLLSYLPFFDGDSSHGLLERMIKNQTSMYHYHSTLKATHPYSSWWYEWPVMVRPIWFYSNTITSTIKEGISSFGNPLVWWTGIFAFFYMIYLSYKEKDKTAMFLSLSYLAQYVPWFFVTRIVFIYHYFPSVPFVVLMIAYSIKKLYKKNKDYKIVAYVYTILTVLLFVAFYPVLSGHPVSTLYVDHFLRWFGTWVLL